MFMFMKAILYNWRPNRAVFQPFYRNGTLWSD